MNKNVLSVSALNFYIKNKFDEDNNLNGLFIEGEITNFKNHYASGHFYFSLKDEKSVVRCIMFNTFASRLKFEPQNDMHVVIYGKVSVYERDGQYQIYCEDMQPFGIGALALAYEQLKQKLTEEGLFASEHKKPLPSMPKRIAVITSNTGAAIEDIISICARRNPFVEVIVCPVIVQGENAAKSMIDMLNKVYTSPGIDLIIIGRGGGSYEDLFCFNDEQLIRTLYSSPIPTVSAVGHEIDYTLCDFVCDVRAATPSAAAEISVPLMLTKDEIKQIITNIKTMVENNINISFMQLDNIFSNTIFAKSSLVLNNYNERFLSVLKKIQLLSHQNSNDFSNNLGSVCSKLTALNPLNILSRGYSVVKSNNNVITKSSQVNVNDTLNITLNEGNIDCVVTNKE